MITPVNKSGSRPASSNKYEAHWDLARTAALISGLQVIEHGWEQHVIIDEENDVVYRYPRHKAAAEKLTDEISVLEKINKHQWPIALPVMITHTKQYSSYKLVRGEVIMHGQAESLSNYQCNAIGKGLGLFLAKFHALEHSIVMQKKTRQTTTLLEYYNGRIKRAGATQFYASARKRLEELQNHTSPKLRVVVHGDLHGPNIVIDPSTKALNGIIDFSEVEIGNPHQEFRKLFMTDPRLLLPAIQSYEEHGGHRLNLDEVVLWAYVNEWANMCHFADTPENPTYQRARQHLQNWGQI